KLNDNEVIYIIAGTIPNRKSTPVVDEWFGLKFKNGKFVEEMTMEQVILKTGFGRNDVPNRNNLPESAKGIVEEAMNVVVEEAQKVLKRYFKEYQDNIDPLIYEELGKLDGLKDKHKTYQLSLFESERKKDEEERRVDALFNTYIDWVHETLEIEDNPYLRVVAVLMGV
ncbi:MAG: ATP-dependent helicase, partial [Clostridiaceae bacterium]|nr:ATP-dependent helicase [Clostridiaceae bacterium]